MLLPLDISNANHKPRGPKLFRFWAPIFSTEHMCNSSNMQFFFFCICCHWLKMIKSVVSAPWWWVRKCWSRCSSELTMSNEVVVVACHVAACRAKGTDVVGIEHLISSLTSSRRRYFDLKKQIWKCTVSPLSYCLLLRTTTPCHIGSVWESLSCCVVPADPSRFSLQWNGSIRYSDLLLTCSPRRHHRTICFHYCVSLCWMPDYEHKKCNLN